MMNSALNPMVMEFLEDKLLEYLVPKEALQHPHWIQTHPRYIPPWHPEHIPSNNGFKVNLDVQQFEPHELKVKLVNDSLIVEGKHEEKRDNHGWISRHFTRKYKLPPNVMVESLSSQLSSDGILTVQAPVKEIAGEEEVPTTLSSPIIKQLDKKQKLELPEGEN